MKCVRCGEEIGEARACRWCGAMQPEGRTKEAAERDERVADSEESAATEGDDEKDTATETSDDIEKKADAKASDSSDAAERKRVGHGRKLVIIYSCIAAVLVAFITFALATAERWEKVDVPEERLCRRFEFRLGGRSRCLDPVHIPAQTHEAVCYLGFIGECPEGDEATETD